MSFFVNELKKVIHENYSNNFPGIMNVPRKLNTTFKSKKDTSVLQQSLVLLTIQKIAEDIPLEALENTYNILRGYYSKNLFVNLIALRLIFSKISLDIERNPLWSIYYQLEKDMEHTPNIIVNKIKLKFYDLNAIGYDLKMYYSPLDIFTDFILKQYEFNKENVLCKAEKGDYVIDGGACFGDTALYFSHEVGENGKVFSFEFIKDNIDVFKKNVSLNRHYAKNIRLSMHPLWSISGKEVYMISDGPASRVSLEKPINSECISVVKTITIDDFVKQQQIQKIDFIKLDIEGAELNALHGAEETIKRFKPKLAICLYHNIQHFATIPDYLNGLALDYDLYIDHFTPHLGETVLFAVPKNRNFTSKKVLQNSKHKEVIKEGIVVIDSLFPQSQPFGFRNYEISGLMELMPSFKSYTMYPMRPGKEAWFKHGYGSTKETFYSNKARYLVHYPKNKNKVKYLDPTKRYHFKLAYSYFLSETFTLLPFYEQNTIPFIFVLYPGGAFGLHNESSDTMLKRIFTSPCFKKVIVTQKITYTYLLEKKLCPKEKIEYLFGTYSQFTMSDALPKKFYKKDKDTFDICFVAAKYLPKGVDKGYDLVIEAAKSLCNAYSDIRFHIVGGFDANDIDISSIEGKITFYGYQRPDFLRTFYTTMDVCLSPHRLGQLYEGNFHGFPLGGECMFLGTAFFTTDMLGNNDDCYSDDEIVFIKPELDDIVAKLAFYYNHLDKLYNLSRKGQVKSEQIMNPRRRLVQVVNILTRNADIQFQSEINEQSIRPEKLLSAYF